jgi:hypothetical protein
MTDNHGYLKGEICNRQGCVGIISEHPSESCCSCHINPPCSYCTDAREYCPVCNWEGREEQLDRQYKPANNDIQSVYNRLMAREDTHRSRVIKMRNGELPIEKITWYDEGHTHFTMKKIGVFPPNTSFAELQKQLLGTFGGRFEQLNLEKGTFIYIAYTD